MPRHTLNRREFLGFLAGASTAVLAGCGSGESGNSSGESTAAGISGMNLTFVGDDAFAPYRYLETQADGTQKVVGLDIAVADELASRLGFAYAYEAQEFAATLASVQGSQTSFTMAMSSNTEREETFDFTRGYYQPRVGVLTLGGEAIKTLDSLSGKSIACTTGTVQNKFIAEGQSMRDANEGLVLGLLDRDETKDYVGVYRLMAAKGAPFVATVDECIGQMLEDGTIDGFIEQYVGADFKWNGDYSASGTSTVAAG